MIVYTVHEPPSPPADRLDRADGHEFIRDGFSPVAAVLAPFWLLAHQLWLPFAGYLAVLLVLGAAIALFPLNAGWALLVPLALHVVFGFEASSLRRWSLENHGWLFLGTVAGRGAEECERRFYEAWLPDAPPSAPANPEPAGGKGGGLDTPWLSRLTRPRPGQLVAPRKV